MLDRSQYWGRLAMTTLLGVGLAYGFILFAALPIRYLRLQFGRNAFLGASLLSFTALMGLGFWQWGFIYFSLCMLIGLYRELEEKNVSIFLASAVAVTATMGSNIFAFIGYTKLKGIQPLQLLTEKTQPVMEQLHQVPQFKETVLADVLWYLPSFLTISMMMVLFVSVVLFQQDKNFNQKSEMKMFRLPDWLIWVFIGALAGSLIEMGMEELAFVAGNILAITLAAYFFQGLAVFNYFLDQFGVFGFWRVLIYFFVFLQMFLFISGLGVLDYWFDFRNPRLMKPKNNRLRNI